jgi:transporter family protein
MSWLVYALISAVAAAATAILAKLGVEGVPSTLATAIRTCVVLIFAWGLALSGVATAISWLAYFRALQMAPASSVAPIDKLSLAFTLMLAAVWLREPVTWQSWAGVALMVLGALVTRS